MQVVFKGGCAFVVLAVALACSDDGPAGGPADGGGEPSAGGSRGGSGNRGGQNPGGDGGQNLGSGGDGGQSPGSGGRSGVAGSMSLGEVLTYGETYEGGEFHLGPVDWQESQWHNACAPAGGYSSQIRQLEGDLLAGLWNGIPNVAGYCDACIFVTAETGKSALLRVVTYGDTSPNSIDVSPAAFDLLDSGEYPRAMSWQFAKCPDTGNIVYEFQTGSSQWWTSLWVRNARVPLAKVEVQSANHGSYVELERGSDGTLTDGSGFGEGAFSLRLTGIDGAEVVDEFDWPGGGVAGVVLEGSGNFE